MMNGDPVRRSSTQPIIPNTTQWRVPIIDQSGPHGQNDSRFKNGQRETG